MEEHDLVAQWHTLDHRERQRVVVRPRIAAEHPRVLELGQLVGKAIRAPQLRRLEPLHGLREPLVVQEARLDEDHLLAFARGELGRCTHRRHEHRLRRGLDEHRVQRDHDAGQDPELAREEPEI